MKGFRMANIKQNAKETEKAKTLGSRLDRFITGTTGGTLQDNDFNTLYQAVKVLKRLGKDGVFEVVNGG